MEGAREFSQLKDNLGAGSDATRKRAAPGTHVCFSLSPSTVREFICDSASVGSAPGGPSSLKVARGAAARETKEIANTSSPMTFAFTRALRSSI